MVSPYEKIQVERLTRKDVKRLVESIRQCGLTEPQMEEYFTRLAAKLIWRANQLKKSRRPSVKPGQPRPATRPDPTRELELTYWYQEEWELSPRIARILYRSGVFPSQIRGMSVEEIDSIHRIGPETAQLIYDAARSHPVYSKSETLATW